MNIKLLFRHFRLPVTSPVSTPKDSVNPSVPLLNNDKHASLSTEELFRRHEDSMRNMSSMSNEEFRRYEYETLVRDYRLTHDAVMRDYAGNSSRTPANPNVIMNPPTRNSNSVMIGSLNNPNLYISDMRREADNNVAIPANMMGNSPSLNVTPNTNVPISALISEEVRAEREFNRRREEERELAESGFRRREESRRLSNYPNENDRIYSNQEHSRINAVNDLLTGSRNAADRSRREDNVNTYWRSQYQTNSFTGPSTVNQEDIIKSLNLQIAQLKQDKLVLTENNQRKEIEILKLREQVSKGKNAISDLDVSQ